MTGPEHYLKAEQLLTGQHFKIEGEPFHNPPSEREVAEAQVHATLALAAATIAAPFVGEGNTTEAWLRITSGPATDGTEGEVSRG